MDEKYLEELAAVLNEKIGLNFRGDKYFVKDGELYLNQDNIEIKIELPNKKKEEQK